MFGHSLYHTPKRSYEEQCFHEFFLSSQNSSSAIRGYPIDGSGWIYFAVVGNGSDRKFGKVYLCAPLTYSEMAVEFGRQGNASAVTRSVYEHGRFSRNAQLKGLESHFRMILVFGQCRDGNLVWFNWIMPANPTDILWRHHQLELALSFAVGKNQADLGRLLDYLCPFAEIIWQNLMEEWVYAFDAILHKLPSEEDRAAYWQHHRMYFESMALVEYSVPTQAHVDICLETYTSFSQMYQQALREIQEFFEALWESVLHPNEYPIPEQVLLGRKFGCRMFLYSHGSFRLYAEYRKDIYIEYPRQINAVRDLLKLSIRQLGCEWQRRDQAINVRLVELIPNYMGPLEAVYGNQCRTAMQEARRTGGQPRLPKLSC
ncbi:hypothetical protein B0H14DRAFT_2702536 [Mycena olivaceomarginata]|nr:hypothetical protein B0H14DRAFT_2804089 [Mycena olivaceomarginata]KAJ7882981.1 hypothetical protein B0H14DRAFT_2702536 [Mycena olivaceomarginata]